MLCELGRKLCRRKLVRTGESVLHVVRVKPVRSLQIVDVLYEHNAQSVRQQKALVGIDYQRIRKLETAQFLFSLFSEYKEPAICGVDVVPEVMPLRDLADLDQWIDRPNISCSRRGDHKKRIQPSGFVGF